MSKKREIAAPRIAGLFEDAPPAPATKPQNNRTPNRQTVKKIQRQLSLSEEAWSMVLRMKVAQPRRAYSAIVEDAIRALWASRGGEAGRS